MSVTHLQEAELGQKPSQADFFLGQLASSSTCTVSIAAVAVCIGYNISTPASPAKGQGQGDLSVS